MWMCIFQLFNEGIQAVYLLPFWCIYYISLSYFCIFSRQTRTILISVFKKLD